MMRKKIAAATATLTSGFTSLAHAVSEETGTGAVAEMNISGGQFALLVGGVIVVGLVLWLVVRLMNK